MIERITPYCPEDRALPEMVVVLCEGEGFEHPYVPKRRLVAVQDENMRLRELVGMFWPLVEERVSPTQRAIAEMEMRELGIEVSRP